MKARGISDEGLKRVANVVKAQEADDTMQEEDVSYRKPRLKMTWIEDNQLYEVPISSWEDIKLFDDNAKAWYHGGSSYGKWEEIDRRNL